MTPAKFLETRRPAWNRVEELVAKAVRGNPSRLSDVELRELARIYPTVAVDVARARMHDLDAATQRRINELAIATHGLLYRRRRVRPLAAVWRFYRGEFPQLFRRLWAYMALSTAIFVVGALGAYSSTRLRPSTAYLFVPGSLDLPDGRPGVTAEDMSERFRQMPNAPMAAGIMTNNISVAFNAFALGITAGIGTCFFLLYNAMMIGGIAGHFANHHLQYAFWSFIVPHGALEILAILIAAAAGLRLGLSLAVPGPMTRTASLRHGAREAVLLVLGTVPMFVVAGVIEGFVTPSHLPGGVKIAGGVSVGAAAIAYLLVGGRGRRSPAQ
ncbi:MAG: stage II sporulation protein M [Phycisphaerae bacterium]|nr:stage II sporulation protein M [Phycisphaerae bacterium]